MSTAIVTTVLGSTLYSLATSIGHSSSSQACVLASMLTGASEQCCSNTVSYMSSPQSTDHYGCMNGQCLPLTTCASGARLRTAWWQRLA